MSHLIAATFRFGTAATRGWIESDDEGLIVALGSGEPPRSPDADFDDGLLFEAGDFNAHSHPEQSLYTDLVDRRWDLATWCRHTIYRFSPHLGPYEIGLGCLRAFSRMLAQGVTSVAVSYYLHGRRGNELDRAVIAAARKSGIRLLFGRMNYDRTSPGAYPAKAASQAAYFESPQEARRAYEELKDEESATVTVAPSLHSLHGSSKEAIVEGLRLAWRDGRPLQFHLSEDSQDVDLSLKEQGLRPLAFFDDLLRSGQVPSLEPLLLSDCCWIDDEERAIIAKRGMKVVLDGRMNDRVRTGEADLPALLARGILPWLGTDGEASNDDLSVTGERRHLARRWQLDEGFVEAMSRRPFPMGKGTVGPLAVGAFADVVGRRKDLVEEVLVGGRPVLSRGRHRSLDVEREIEGPLKEAMERLDGTVPRA